MKADESMERKRIARLAIPRLAASIPTLGLCFFLTAGTFSYWQAWVYLTVLIGPMLVITFYFMKKDPKFLERRMRMREKEADQKMLIRIAYLPYLLILFIPGLDRRFGWSNLPVYAVIVGDLLTLLGYGIVFFVFRENPFASRIIEVEQEQPVIQSGPYAIVRHPMYAGSMLLYIFTPLALGSLWGMVPALLIIPIYVIRILGEERVLARDLPGYREYMHKTRYRLIPGIW